LCTCAPKTTINRCKLRLRIINNKADCRGKITRFGQYGLAESTGWVGAGDGLLVRDLNDNGQIDNGTELFGNNSVLSSGATAANGFEALADLDSNQDGVFNSSDSA
jgi:iron-regulated protein frpC, putative